MRTKSYLKYHVPLTLAAIFSTPAIAHTGDSGPGLIAGLLHPFTGLDHVLPLVFAGACVGLYYLARSRSRR